MMKLAFLWPAACQHAILFLYGTACSAPGLSALCGTKDRATWQLRWPTVQPLHALCMLPNLLEHVIMHWGATISMAHPRQTAGGSGRQASFSR